MKHYKLVDFLSNLNVKPPPCTNVKTPGTNIKPLLTTFWRRFCRELRSICGKQTTELILLKRTEEQLLEDLCANVQQRILFLRNTGKHLLKSVMVCYMSGTGCCQMQSPYY